MLHPSVVAWRPLLTIYIKGRVLFTLEDLLIWNRGLSIWKALAKAFVITLIIS
jgi:hypothetical protein